ncbi:MAG TPA: hypothetical protein VHE54_03185 [Puia sp.]|nr:hypothetical protein [Puia sp.]
MNKPIGNTGVIQRKETVILRKGLKKGIVFREIVFRKVVPRLRGWFKDRNEILFLQARPEKNASPDRPALQAHAPMAAI